MKKLIGILAAAGLASAANAQLGTTDAIPGTFMDVSATGTNINLVADDGTVAVTLPAAYGNTVLPAGTIYVGSNGQVTDSFISPFSNSALSGTNFAGYYPFWDDLRTDNPGAGVFTQDMGDRFIIQWNNVRTFDTPAPIDNVGTFQLQIFASGPVLAQYLYNDVDWGNLSSNGASATVGAVGAGATPRAFAQYSLNASVISPNVVVSIIPAPGAAALLGLGGLVAARRRR